MPGIYSQNVRECARAHALFSHREDVGALDTVVAPAGTRLVARHRAVARQDEVGEPAPFPVGQLQPEVYGRPRGRDLHGHLPLADAVRAVQNFRRPLLPRTRQQQGAGERTGMFAPRKLQSRTQPLTKTCHEMREEEPPSDGRWQVPTGGEGVGSECPGMKRGRVDFKGLWAGGREAGRTRTPQNAKFCLLADHYLSVMLCAHANPF